MLVKLLGKTVVANTNTDADSCNCSISISDTFSCFNKSQAAANLCKYPQIHKLELFLKPTEKQNTK